MMLDRSKAAMEAAAEEGIGTRSSSRAQSLKHASWHMQAIVVHRKRRNTLECVLGEKRRRCGLLLSAFLRAGAGTFCPNGRLFFLCTKAMRTHHINQHVYSGEQPSALGVIEYLINRRQITLADVVQIHPNDFHKPSIRSIEDFINTKYADKVIHRVGLCIGFHSLISASEGLIGHGTGIVNVNVDFRLVVFRPFKGEIMRATITQSSQQGIYLSVDFFEDLLVPPETLFEGSTWEKDDSGTMTFVWRTEAGGGAHNEFFFDNAESCMVRIEEEQWHDVSPDALRSQSYVTQEEEENASRMPPYLVRGSMMHTGLGPTLWWIGEPGLEDEATDGVMNGT